ncbi:MAG: hypothetical protein QNJ12_19425 [Ilumatobacter sp.]|uniref:hypothetical protein n=1 Tax=Ilumatobacter sp. TaxID=1967498 RepID=UPI00260A4647|nr:hypothetical protein [Ilumatobacter sp.]MDJ0770973.1 hypothetical protein [Ilumatobacter sp.]
MLIVAIPVLVAVAIILLAVAWAAHHDTLLPTDQELVDIEFDAMVRRLDVDHV